MLLSSPVSPGGVVSSGQCNISPVSTLLYSDPARCDPCVRAEGGDFQKVLSCLQRRGSHTATGRGLQMAGCLVNPGAFNIYV